MGIFFSFCVPFSAYAFDYESKPFPCLPSFHICKPPAVPAVFPSTSIVAAHPVIAPTYTAPYYAAPTYTAPYVAPTYTAPVVTSVAPAIAV